MPRISQTRSRSRHARLGIEAPARRARNGREIAITKGAILAAFCDEAVEIDVKSRRTPGSGVILRTILAGAVAAPAEQLVAIGAKPAEGIEGDHAVAAILASRVADRQPMIA